MLQFPSSATSDPWLPVFSLVYLPKGASFNGVSGPEPTGSGGEQRGEVEVVVENLPIFSCWIEQSFNLYALPLIKYVRVGD